VTRARVPAADSWSYVSDFCERTGPGARARGARPSAAARRPRPMQTSIVALVSLHSLHSVRRNQMRNGFGESGDAVLRLLRSIAVNRAVADCPPPTCVTEDEPLPKRVRVAEQLKARATPPPPPPPVQLHSFYGASLPPPAALCRQDPYKDDFKTQAEAFAWGDCRIAELSAEEEDAALVLRRPPVPPRFVFFSLEEHASGARRFGASTTSELWRRYRALPPHERHFYELLREGSPCHLYFDLEFSCSANAGLSGVSAVDALLSLLTAALPARLGVEMEDCTLIELDSSTDAKFSRHLIVRMPGVAFSSATSAGAFVRAFWHEDVAASRGADTRADALFVRKTEGEDVLVPFVDMGVYTRNRAFRLYLSSKAGKEARLLPSRRCWERLHACGLAPTPPPDDGSLDQPAQWLFMAALICDVAGDALLLGPVQPGDESAARPPPLPRRARPSTIRAESATALCPFPHTAAAVCAFADAAAGGGAPAARVRSWVALSRTHLAINLSGTRHCARVGRAHKSNGIYYLVSFKDGAAYRTSRPALAGSPCTPSDSSRCPAAQKSAMTPIAAGSAARAVRCRLVRLLRAACWLAHSPVYVRRQSRRLALRRKMPGSHRLALPTSQRCA